MTEVDRIEASAEVTVTDTGDIFADIDRLVEAGQLEKITDLADDVSYIRVGLYLASMASIMSAPDERDKLFRLCVKMYLKFGNYVHAMRVALKMNDSDLIQEVLNLCPDSVTQKQLALLLARHRHILNFGEVTKSSIADPEELQRIASLEILPAQYKALAAELDVVEPKTPEEIFKTHLEEGRRGGVALDSARQNLASSFVNAFVNIGFC